MKNLSDVVLFSDITESIFSDPAYNLERGFGERVMRKKILFISQDRHLGEAVRSVLTRNSIEVVLASTLSQVERFIDRDFDVILFEELFGSTISEMISFFGVHAHLKNTERWLIAPKGSTAMERKLLKSEWKLKQVLSNPISPLDIMEILREKKKQTQKPIFLNSLRLVSQIWANRSSMVVQGRSLKVIFIEGSLVSHSNISIISDLLQEDFLRPSPISMSANQKNFKKVGLFLLSLAKEIPSDAWMEKHQDHMIVWPQKSDLPEYLLSKEEFETLRNEKPFSKQSSSEQELLYGLWKMGIIRLQEKTVEEEKTSRLQLSLSASDMKMILEKDLKRFQDASALEVLGLASGAGLSEILNNSRRLEERYNKIKLDYPHSREISPLVDKLVDFVQTSAQMLSGGGYVQEDTLPEHEQLYQYGLRQINNQNWAMAEKALSKASQMRIEDGRILAAKGWAEFNNPDRDKTEREKNGLESLLLAIHLNKEDLNTLIFIAKAYLALGDPENALGPVKKASTLTPAPEVQELRKEVEKRIQRLRTTEG